jgi:tRNA A37 threonylcarbamoyladenosine biosynthesis protein TsaE
VLHHVDLYRLSGGGDDRELGLEELPGEQGVLAVEWPERLSDRPWTDPWRVTLEHAGGDVRRLTIVPGRA